MDAMDTERQEYARRYGQVAAKAWIDDAYKARLLAEPKTVLQEQGIVLPDDLEVRMVENAESEFLFALPPRPEGDLSDEDLAAVAGGGSTVGTAGTAGTLGTAFTTVACFSTAGTAGTAG